MEAIEKLKMQIEPILSTMKLQREANTEIREQVARLESDNSLKDEYIKALEDEISALQSGGKIGPIDKEDGTK